MHLFSERTLAILAASGWTPQRKIDISDEFGLLESEGYSAFYAAIDFLEQFGRLQLSVPNPIVTNLYNIFNIQIDRAMRIFRRKTVEIYAEELGVRLCPIGADNSSIFFAMDTDGKVYGLYDRDILFIGESGERAIENYCNWHPSSPFPIIRDPRNEP